MGLVNKVSARRWPRGDAACPRDAARVSLQAVARHAVTWLAAAALLDRLTHLCSPQRPECEPAGARGQSSGRNRRGPLEEWR
jgi:hypothetical protein